MRSRSSSETSLPLISPRQCSAFPTDSATSSVCGRSISAAFPPLEKSSAASQSSAQAALRHSICLSFVTMARPSESPTASAIRCFSSSSPKPVRQLIRLMLPTFSGAIFSAVQPPSRNPTDHICLLQKLYFGNSCRKLLNESLILLRYARRTVKQQQHTFCGSGFVQSAFNSDFSTASPVS